MDYYVKTTGNDSSGDGSLSAPYATPGKALGVAVAGAAGWSIYAEAGTYPVTTATQNVAGGTLNFNQEGSQSVFNRMIGHAVGNTAIPAQFTLALQGGLGGVTLLNFNNAQSYNSIENVALVGNAVSGNMALFGQGRSNRCRNLSVSGWNGGGQTIVLIASNFTLDKFSIIGGNTGNSAALGLGGAVICSNGIVAGNNGRGVDIASFSAVELTNVKSHSHTGGNGYGFFLQGACEFSLKNCISYNNEQSNFAISGTNSTGFLSDCISYGAGAYAFDNLSRSAAIALLRCASNAGGSGLYPVMPQALEGFVALTENPFTTTGTGDIRLTESAGDLLASLDLPSSWLPSAQPQPVSFFGSAAIGSARRSN